MFGAKFWAWEAVLAPDKWKKMPYITCRIILIDIHNVLVLDTKCRSQNNSFFIQLFMLSMVIIETTSFFISKQTWQKATIVPTSNSTMYSYTKRYHKHVWKQTNKTWHIFLFLSYINSISTLFPTTDTNHSQFCMSSIQILKSFMIVIWS